MDKETKPTHTPGPWHYHNLNGNNYVYVAEIHTKHDRWHYAVADCLCHSGIDTKTARANAALIARAPELAARVSELEQLVGEAVHGVDHWEQADAEYWAHWVHRARAALRKEGE